MRDVVKIVRQGDHLLVLYEALYGEEEPPKPFVFDGTEDQLHSGLTRQGYIRTEPYGDDQIAGRYVRKVAA